jgi:hypothetical protein
MADDDLQRKALLTSLQIDPQLLEKIEKARDFFLRPAADKSYPPKMRALIDAYHAVRDDPKLLKGKTHKQALMAWLEKNAAKYDGLITKKGKPNVTAIEQIAQIANQSKGGPPKTPFK